MNAARLLAYEGDPEPAMDELKQLPGQVQKLTSDVEHIQKDVADIKVDIRRIEDRLDGMDARMSAMDERLCAKIEAGYRRLDDKIDRIYASSSEKLDTLQKDLASAKIWAFGLYVAQGAALLFVMAKGFKWF